jgi:hypothetical protein
MAGTINLNVNYTGTAQSLTVPANATVSVTLAGGRGGNGGPDAGGTAGSGGSGRGGTFNIPLCW